MNLFRTLAPAFAGMVLACASWTAHGAAAVAVASNNMSYTALDYKDLERAKEEALRGCREMGSDCKLTVWTRAPRAIALAKGPDGNAQAIDASPAKARDTAMAGCRRLSKACKFVALYWESGGAWAAWALATDSGGSMVHSHFASDHASEAAAREDALNGCHAAVKNQPGATCKVHTHWGAWTRIVAESASYTSAYVGPEHKTAEAEALRACRAGTKPGDSCKVSDVTHNPGPIAAPASFAKIAAQTSIAKEKAQAVRRPVRTSVQQALTCSNRCVNGSCVRSFPNGRTERWQAPRVFDPFIKDWKWDTSSCGA